MPPKKREALKEPMQACLGNSRDGALLNVLKASKISSPDGLERLQQIVYRDFIQIL